MKFKPLNKNNSIHTIARNNNFSNNLKKKISDIEIGDIVLTSNLSIYFPPNLPVGEVVSIFEKSDSSNRIVRMKLFSDLSKINQLFVILNEGIE